MATLRCVTAAMVIGSALLGAGCAVYQGARLYQSGSAALDRGDTTRAISDLERAATLAPERSEVQNHLGLAYSQAGRSEEAERAFRRAVELDCSNQAAQENLRFHGRADQRTGP